jgi:hypothetical protein
MKSNGLLSMSTLELIEHAKSCANPASVQMVLVELERRKSKAARKAIPEVRAILAVSGIVPIVSKEVAASCPKTKSDDAHRSSDLIQPRSEHAVGQSSAVFGEKQASRIAAEDGLIEAHISALNERENFVDNKYLLKYYDLKSLLLGALNRSLDAKLSKLVARRAEPSQASASGPPCGESSEKQCEPFLGLTSSMRRDATQLLDGPIESFKKTSGCLEAIDRFIRRLQYASSPDFMKQLKSAASYLEKDLELSDRMPSISYCIGEDISFIEHEAPALLERSKTRMKLMSTAISDLHNQHLNDIKVRDLGRQFAYKVAFEEEVKYIMEIYRTRRSEWEIISSPYHGNSDAEQEAGRRLLSGG